MQIERCLPQIKLCPGQIEPYAGLMQPHPLLLASDAPRLKRQEGRMRAGPQLFLPIIQRLRRSVNRFSLVFSRRAAIC